MELTQGGVSSQGGVNLNTTFKKLKLKFWRKIKKFKMLFLSCKVDTLIIKNTYNLNESQDHIFA